MLAVARAAQQTAVDHTGVWLLVAAALVGFAAAWLVLEVRRARSPEGARSNAESAPAVEQTDALERVLPALVDQIEQLRAEIEDMRARETERALRARLRERA